MKSKQYIDEKLDNIISDLMSDVGLDDWCYISDRLEFIAKNIRKARGLELTEDYVRSCFKTFMEKCNEDI